ncbi:MAG: Trk-type K+ transport system [Candidatus Alkanophagales archaeon MCA70_species_1]|nr:Trk-type K+ transport system [Candidatus Alkanophaga volatiphilum]
MKNAKVVLRDLGSVFEAAGVVMLLPLVVAAVFDEFYIMKAFLGMALGVLAAGAALRLAFRRAGDTELKHAMACAALSWLLLALASTAPFVYCGMSFLDAFFETMSGWTGTGLTMVLDPSELPRTLQFWRSLMQWVGGVGVIVLMLSILARPGTASYHLYVSEAREEKIKPSVVSTVRTIWWIYLLLTLVGVPLLWLCGMPLWDAINHTMTGISTGGFSVVKGSIGAYHNIRVELALLPIMVLGALPFLIHYKVLTGELKAFFKDVQCRWLFFLIFILLPPLLLEVGGVPPRAALASLSAWMSALSAALRESGFQLVSGLTCTGFQTADVHSWTAGAKLILATAMLIGGAAGSTAGGIKLLRAAVVFSSIRWSFRRILLPKTAITYFRLGGRALDEREASRIVMEVCFVTLLWLFFLLVGIIIVSHVAPPPFDISDVVFEVVSAQSNVGLSTGLTGPDLHYLGKIALIFNMWVGRLEIIPVLMLFRALVRGFEPW